MGWSWILHAGVSAGPILWKSSRVHARAVSERCHRIVTFRIVIFEPWCSCFPGRFPIWRSLPVGERAEAAITAFSQFLCSFQRCARWRFLGENAT
jgi:hypothetical protein